MTTGAMMMLKSMLGIDPDEIKSAVENVLKSADDRLLALETDVSNIKASLARIEMYLMPQLSIQNGHQTVEVKEITNV